MHVTTPQLSPRQVRWVAVDIHHTASTTMSDRPAPAAPAGWVVQWDDEYQTYYFVDLSTGHSQWEVPASPGAASVLLEPDEYLGQMERQFRRQEREWGHFLEYQHQQRQYEQQQRHQQLRASFASKLGAGVAIAGAGLLLQHVIGESEQPVVNNYYYGKHIHKHFASHSEYWAARDRHP